MIFLEKLQNIRTNPDALLISLDVDSLYTNLDNEMGMKAVTEAFNRDPKHSETPATINGR